MRHMPGLVAKTENHLIYNRMKRLCKDIDITDRGLISRAVYACLNKKYKRNDVTKYLSQVSGLDRKYIRCIYYRYGKSAMYPFTELVIAEIQQEITHNTISFPAIWYREKVDGSSGKVRCIGIQNIKQQLYDYIAVEGLQPVIRRIGEYQYASIEGRGTTKGKEVISRWIRNKNMRYFVKLDVRKCFESIDHKKLMEFLRRHIRNELLLDLINLLIRSFERGLSIGSYLSQYLCNLYMSILYHEIMENMYRMRNSKKRVNLVRHCLIYMDDILMIGSRKRDMEKAVRLTVRKAAEMGLEIKLTYQVRQIDGNCIDMLGYKIYRTHAEIRGRTYLRVRRAFRRARKCLTEVLARKCLSYNGYLIHTNSKRMQRKLKTTETLQRCKELIKYESKIFTAATAG